MTRVGLEDIAERLGRTPASLLGRSEGTRQAAVAAILRSVAGEPEVLFIRRAEHPSDPWSGHMAFPGGRHDPTDPDLLDTARRETLEELGLDLGRHARLLGMLDEIEAIARGRRTGMVIRPYVFALDEEPELSPNDEVAEVVWAPLVPMLRGENATTLPYRRDGLDLVLPGYDVGGRVVWGLTYEMLQRLFSLLR